MRIEAMQSDLQKQLNETNNRIQGEEDQIANLDAQGGKVRADGEKLKGEVKVQNSSKFMQIYTTFHITQFLYFITDNGSTIGSLWGW